MSVKSLNASVFGFRSFEAEDEKVAVDIARHDQLASLGKCAASRPAIAGIGSKEFFGFELPHLSLSL
jgi:hypothetical protein